MVLTACSNEEPEVTTENEESEEVARLKEENEELKRQQDEQENDAEHEDSKESTKDDITNNQETSESSDEKQETSSNTPLVSNDDYVNKILNQTDYISKYPQANTTDTEQYSMLVEEYIYRLAGYYNSGQKHAKDVFYYLEEGSTPYNTVIENQESGNFANYEIEEVLAYQVFDIGDGNVIVDTYRTYTHANTNGVQGSDVTYIMNKDSYKVLGWIETDTYDISEDGHKHGTYGLTSYGDEQEDSNEEDVPATEVPNPDAEIQDRKIYEGAINEYLGRLAQYYNYDNYDNIYYYLKKGSAAYDKITANKASGNFTGHNTENVELVEMTDLSDGTVKLNVNRVYSHDSSDGRRIANVDYVVNAETHEVLDFEQVSDTAY